MRLQLTASILVSGTAVAADDVGARVDVYQDPWITVVMPTARASSDRTDTTVSATTGVDFVSGATPALLADTISSATHFNDTRGSASLNVSVHPETDWAAGGDVAMSTESDFRSVQIGANGRTDLFDRRATASTRISVGALHSWRATGGLAEQESLTGQFDVDVAVVVDRSTTLTAFATGRTEHCAAKLGCEANPYRFVAFTSGDTVLRALHERHPDERWRGAGAVRLSRLLGDRTGLHATYRLYGDSWGVTGHTGSVAVAAQSEDERVFLRCEARGALQGPATFASDRYPASTQDISVAGWRTGDAELSGLSELALEVAARWSTHPLRRFERVSFDVRLAAMRFRYPHFPERPARDAILVGGGFGATF